MKRFINILEQNELSESQINTILTKAKTKEIKTQEVVFDGRSSSQTVYFILKGSFVLKYWDEVLEYDRTVNFFIDDFSPFMGDINSYFGEEKINCRLVAIKKSKILAFGKKDIEFLTQQFENFKVLVNKQIIDALVFENNLRIQLITKTKPNFYEYLLDNYPQIIKEVPSKFIAEFMGISPEWLSKIKRKALNS